MSIVYFCGRKQSGKTTLAKTLYQQGYKKFSFADVLKKGCAEIFKFPLEACYDSRKADLFETPINLHEYREQLENEFKVDLNEIPWEKVPAESKSIRDVLQHVGTEVLRAYDDNYHIKATIASLDTTQNLVCDDCRFPNEKKALDDLNSLGYFLIRPLHTEVDNHDSEISLQWNNFREEQILINDSTEEDFVKKFEQFQLNGNGMSVPEYFPTHQGNNLDSDSIDFFMCAGYIAAKLKKGDYKFSTHGIIINELKDLPEPFCEFLGVKLKDLEDKEVEEITNVFLLEDLKKYNIYQGSTFNLPEHYLNKFEDFTPDLVKTFWDFMGEIA